MPGSMGRNMKAFSKTNLLPFFVSFVASCETPSLASLRLCERKSKRRTNPPAGERGIAPRKNAATGDSRCVVARTGRAWLCDHRCERRTGKRTKPSIRPCDSGRRRGGLASCPSDRRGLCSPCADRGADRSRSRCQSAVWRSPNEHRPSSGGEKRSADRPPHPLRAGI